MMDKFETKHKIRTEFLPNNKMRFVKEITASDPHNFYFSVWCKESIYTQVQSWKVDQRIVQTMRDAAIMFAKRIVEGQSVIVNVQDWRGRIAKFKITVKLEPVYYARRIK